MNSIATIRTAETVNTAAMSLNELETLAAAWDSLFSPNRRQTLGRQRQSAIDAIVESGIKVETGCTTRGFAVAT